MACTLSLVVAGCSALQSRMAGSNALRVGTSGSYPPFSVKQGGSLQGIEIDYAQALGQELGRPARIVQVPFPDLIGELNAGRIDIIMAGMSRTSERAALVSFAEPYLRVGQMLLLRKDDDAKLAGIGWLHDAGVRIGFERATTGADFVKQRLTRCKPVEYANKEDALAALRANKIDALIHDAPFIWNVTGSPQQPNQELVGRFVPLTKESLAWAVRKDDYDLLAKVNGVIARWKDSGKLAEVLDHWIKVRKVTKKTSN